MSKGTDREIFIQKHLEDRYGYITDRARASYYVQYIGGKPQTRSRGNDFFGCIDVIGILPGMPVIMIQSCGSYNRAVQDRMVKIQDTFGGVYDPRRIIIAIGRWVGGRKTKYKKQVHGWTHKPAQYMRFRFYLGGESWSHDYRHMLFKHAKDQEYYAPDFDLIKAAQEAFIDA